MLNSTQDCKQSRHHLPVLPSSASLNFFFSCANDTSYQSSKMKQTRPGPEACKLCCAGHWVPLLLPADGFIYARRFQQHWGFPHSCPNLSSSVFHDQSVFLPYRQFISLTPTFSTHWTFGTCHVLILTLNKYWGFIFLG